MIGTHPVQLVFAGHCVAMVLFPVRLIMVIVKGNLFLLGQGPGQKGQHLSRLSRPSQSRQVLYIFLSVVKSAALEPFQLFRQLPDLLGRQMGEIEKVYQYFQIILGQYMVPVPVQSKGCFLTVHHPGHLPAHHRKPRFLQAAQIPADGLPAHRHGILRFHEIKDFLLGQRMVPVRLPKEDLRDPHNGHLASSVTLISCHPNHRPLILRIASSLMREEITVRKRIKGEWAMDCRARCTRKATAVPPRRSLG